MVTLGHVPSRPEAERIIRAGLVKVIDEIIDKPGTLVLRDAPIVVGSTKNFVSRGGLKLERALDRFKVNPSGRICADAGASTGGFSDVLLQRGAAKVYAIDVGYGELDWKIRKNERVVVMERTNARFVATLPDPISLVVADLSFISLQVFYPIIRGWVSRDSDVIFLVKPQFEAGREEVPEGGVVVDPEVHRSVLRRTLHAAQTADFAIAGLIPSPIRGGSGNKEFLLWAQAGENNRQLDGNALDSFVEAAVAENIDTPTT